MLKITLNEMVFSGIHGCYPNEKTTKQPFKIHVELKLDIPTNSLQSDNLEDTVDWFELYKLIRHEVENTHFNLTESLAYHLANKILQTDKKISSVTIKISKLKAWQTGYPTAQLTLSR